MLNAHVLVLNHSYLPIHVTSVRRAFSLIYQDVARALDEGYQAFDFGPGRGSRRKGWRRWGRPEARSGCRA